MSLASIPAAGIISLLTHTCISVGLHIVVHPQLTHAHQSSYHWGLHTNTATPAVEIPAIPSQIQILSQAQLQLTSKKTDAVSSLSQRNAANSRNFFFAGTAMCQVSLGK